MCHQNLRTRISSIMSILVHALNLRLSADENVDFAPYGKYQLSETARRRWLEWTWRAKIFACHLDSCLAPDLFDGVSCACACATLIYLRFLSKISNSLISGKTGICTSYTKLCTFRVFVLLLLISWFGWYFTYIGGRWCTDLQENTRVMCVWMLLTFLDEICCFRLTL